MPRATFDELLLRHSEKSGVAVRERHRALDAAFDAGGVTLRFADPEGAEHAVRVGVVVDASGRTGFLAKKLGRHAFDPLLRNIAVHAQYENIPRATGGARATSGCSRGPTWAGSGSSRSRTP